MEITGRSLENVLQSNRQGDTDLSLGYGLAMKGIEIRSITNQPLHFVYRDRTGRWWQKWKPRTYSARKVVSAHSVICILRVPESCL